MGSEAAEAVRRELAARARETRSTKRRVRASWWWTAVAPVAAAAVWLLLYRAPPGDLAAKGAATVEILVAHGGEVAPWAGEALVAGDRIQLSWTSGRAGYVAVVGRDDTGEVTRWFPVTDTALRLEPGARTFGDSLRFDPPFRGTVYVFVADGPFSLSPLEAAIRERRDPAFLGQAQKLRVPRTP